MTTRKFIVHKAGDSTRENVVSNVHASIDQLDGSKAWKVEISAYRRPRTNDANEYLWGVCHARLTRELGNSTEEWHEFMCGEYFSWVQHDLPGGRTISRPLRTTTTDERGKRDVLPGIEFWRFIEFVRRQAAEAGVYIPEPNEEERA